MPIQPSPRVAARRSAAPLSPPTSTGRPGLLHRLRLERDLGEVEELAVVLDRRLGPEPGADLDRTRRRDGPAWRSRARPRPIPARASSRRSRTRPGPRSRCRASRRPGPRRTDAATRGCRRGSRAGRRRARREEREVGEGVEHRRGRRDRRVLLPGSRRARHRRSGTRGARAATPTRTRGARPRRPRRGGSGRSSRRARRRTSRRARRHVENEPSGWRCHPPAARLPPSTCSVVPVTKPESARVGQEHDRGGDVVDVTGARQRRPHRHLADPRRGDDVGRDAVDPDHALAELERERRGEVRDRGLHGAVDGEARARPGAPRSR